MKPEEYFELHEKLCTEARELSMRKNNDYAAPDSNKEDPYRVFRNFMQVLAFGICPVPQGFLVRLSDKFSRLCNILRPGHVRTVLDEKTKDTILDIINYACLLYAYLIVKKQEEGGLDDEKEANA